MKIAFISKERLHEIRTLPENMEYIIISVEHGPYLFDVSW